jgi:hypothetical protein
MLNPAIKNLKFLLDKILEILDDIIAVDESQA